MASKTRHVVVAICTSVVTTIVMYSIQLKGLSFGSLMPTSGQELQGVTSGESHNVQGDVYDAYFQYEPEEPPDSERGLDLPAILALRGKQVDLRVSASPTPQLEESHIVEAEVAQKISPSPSQSASSLPPKHNLSTKHDCRRIGAWGDVCVYDNMCYDGTYLYYFTPGEPCVGHSGSCRTIYNDGDIMEGIILPQRDVAGVDVKPVPFNGGALSVRVTDPTVLEQQGLNVTWSNKVMWMLPFNYGLDNIWYISSRIMPVYKARKMNMSGLFDPPLPTLQREDAFLYIPHGHSNYAAEWVQEFFTVGTNGSEFVYSDTIPYTLSDSSWLCFNRMVITGTFGALVPDMATTFDFRAEMYAHMGISLPDKPSRNVLFWLRTPPLGRSFINGDDLLKIADDYGVKYTYMTDFPRSFKSQLELFASHGVIVAPHGAGLVNSLYLAPGSSIIEVYPFHFDHNLYRIISTIAGVGHFPVYTFNGSDTWAGHKLHFELNCEDLFGMQSNYINVHCRTSSIYFRIHVSLRDFEAAFVNAINHAGYRIDFKGITSGADPDWMA